MEEDFSYKDPYDLVEEGLEFITGKEESYTDDSVNTEEDDSDEIIYSEEYLRDPTTVPLSLANLNLYDPEKEHLETTWIVIFDKIYGRGFYPPRIDYMTRTLDLQGLKNAMGDIQQYHLFLKQFHPNSASPILYSLKLIELVWKALHTVLYKTSTF